LDYGRPRRSKLSDAELEKNECRFEGFLQRQQEAKDEVGALTKAKEILSSRVRVTGFVQIHGDDAESRAREAVLGKLRDLSHKFNSYALMEMVSAAATDPFEKIRGLISDMIAKLVAEANQEATQKAFCDEEISKSKASQSKKSMTIDKLTSRIDSASAKKAALADSIKALEGDIADLDKATTTATTLRGEEHASFLKESKDYKDAAEAVEGAIQVLKEYYEGASLAQTGSGARQPSFGGARSDAASTILSILEMCGEDFTKSYMEITQAEAQAAAQYKKLMAESTVSKAAKVAEVKGATSEIASLEVALKNHQEDRDMTSTELSAVLGYLDKLKPQCESKSMSYGEKKARREAEIEGLKEALGLLG